MVTSPLDDLRAVAAELRAVHAADWLTDYAARIEAAVAALAPKTLPEMGDEVVDVVTPETVEPLIYEDLVDEKTEDRKVAPE